VPGIPARDNDVSFFSREYPLENMAIEESASAEWAREKRNSFSPEYRAFAEEHQHHMEPIVEWVRNSGNLEPTAIPTGEDVTELIRQKARELGYGEVGFTYSDRHYVYQSRKPAMKGGLPHAICVALEQDYYKTQTIPSMLGEETHFGTYFNQGGLTMELTDFIRSLGYRAKAHRFVVSDAVRVMNRIKSVFRSRGIPVSGKAVYSESGRTGWVKRLPADARPAAEILYVELDALSALRERAQRELIVAARRHRAFRIVSSCPGLGPIRTAEMLPIVVTPYRFANKRDFWGYCGLGIVTRSSSDWVRTRNGQWIKAPVQQTRGLTRTFNRTLKRVFKGAAMTVIGRADETEPLFQHYTKLLDGGTKPNLAKLTLARQIASIALSLWRNEEEYNPKKLAKAVSSVGA